MSVDLSIREQVVAVDDEDAESYVVALRRVHHQLSLLIHLKCFKLLLHPVWGPQKLPLGLRRPAYMRCRRCNVCLAVPALGEISRVDGVAKRQIVGDAITNSHCWHLPPVCPPVWVFEDSPNSPCALYSGHCTISSISNQ